MSQPRPDTAFRSQHSGAKELSSPHLRALRKELLIVRADIERMEFAQATVELRQSVSHFSWLKFLLPGLRGMSWGAGKSANAGIGALLKQYPLISSLASLLLARPLRSTLLASAKPLLKWGGLGFAAWEAYRIWQQMKSDDDTAPAAKSGRTGRGS
ncbi:DUF3318 domain-containing protein [Paraburkholderia megapolitana]|uniref:DUF3318 domain-containing protein n=1 Tax=Paraburkholderia megapolitana TaxID=420953 RepID=A0A1I3GE52_9BURK|nr:DUF3318 domain-containing protein [Paraburkholderia megapolitana]QDQ82867.1 DUF3318 domain-containing protein [Paraburkholderia megapolitana]SFI21776.1 Protein of unknown function [Paraburkholderia megapolitana]